MHPAEASVRLINADLLQPVGLPDAGDITYSVGLVEHFDVVGTDEVIARHFEITRSGGLVLITFPTPTWLYRSVRRVIEWLGLWGFPDERPLGFDEVRAAMVKHGDVVFETINWPLMLTQGVIVARKR